MGINQWTRKPILPGSPFCREYNLPPGEYLIMYDSSVGEIIFKDSTKGTIVKRKQLSSLYDLVYLMPDRERSQVMQELKNKKYPSAGGGFCNHHIIPHFLCNESQLVIEAAKHNRFNKDGDDNLIPLPKDFHKKHHNRTSKYCKTVRRYLEDRWNALSEVGWDNDPDKIEDALKSVVADIRAMLSHLSESGGSMDDI